MAREFPMQNEQGKRASLMMLWQSFPSSSDRWMMSLGLLDPLETVFGHLSPARSLMCHVSLM